MLEDDRRKQFVTSSLSNKMKNIAEEATASSVKKTGVILLLVQNCMTCLMARNLQSYNRAFFVLA
jgi:hypothetical protein